MRNGETVTAVFNRREKPGLMASSKRPAVKNRRYCSQLGNSPAFGK
jgi:hypothetical protein